MYKTYKLSNAEIKKIYSRPSVLIVYLLLAFVIFISSILFNPTPSVTKTTYTGGNVESIYEQFIDKNINKLDYSNIKINEANTSIYAILNLEDKLHEFKTKLENCNNYFANNMESPVRKTITNLSNNTATLEETKKVFLNLKNSYIFPIYNYIVNDLSSNINFYITNNQYTDLKKYFKNFYNAIPSNIDGYTKNEYLNMFNNLNESFPFDKEFWNKINSLKKYNISNEHFNKIKTEYIDNTQNKLKLQFSNIEQYYLEHSIETTNSYKKEINELIAKYCSLANISSSIISSEITLAKAGNYSDSYLQKCIGFNNFRRYSLEENLNINKYLIDKNLNEYDISKNFNFNKQSGYKTNMLDFSFYVLQIASIIIILFLIFNISAIIADEQNKGTIKLVAIRPITRNKILAGKYIGCLLSSIIALILTTLAALIFGLLTYGAPISTTVILSFNAGKAFAMNIYLLFGLYLLNIILNLIFFASIAMFFACLTKSNVITIFISSIIYFLSIGLVNTFNMSSWTKFIPIANIDLFRYFGNNTSGIFSLFIPPDPSLILSILSISLTIITLNIISHIIFTSRDLA